MVKVFKQYLKRHGIVLLISFMTGSIIGPLFKDTITNFIQYKFSQLERKNQHNIQKKEKIEKLAVQLQYEFHKIIEYSRCYDRGLKRQEKNECKFYHRHYRGKRCANQPINDQLIKSLRKNFIAKQSFYEKTIVDTSNDISLTLYSLNEILDDKLTSIINGYYSWRINQMDSSVLPIKEYKYWIAKITKKINTIENLHLPIYQNS